MTAATITTSVEINDPTKEVVVLTATDGETYTSKKFGTIVAAGISANESLGTAVPSVSFSGGVATVGLLGLSDKKVTVTLYGNR